MSIAQNGKFAWIYYLICKKATAPSIFRLRMPPHVCVQSKAILDPSAYNSNNLNDRLSSGKLCARVAKIWLTGPHSAYSALQNKNILVPRAYDRLVSGWIVGPGNSRYRMS